MWYQKMVDIHKIEAVYKDIRSKTKHKTKLMNFKMYYLTNIMQIYEILDRRQYQHGPYNIFLVKENKYRLIMSEGISDKIINHLLSKEILLPLIEPRLIPMNVATRKNKGTKLELCYTKKYLNEIRRKHSNFYILKGDIRKYFYNIDHAILLKKLSRFIPDSDVLKMIQSILEATNTFKTNETIHKVIENEKKYLQDCIEKIRLKLQKDCDLELHPKKTKIFSFHQGLTFLGYRFIVKNNRLVVLMSPKTKKRITKNIKRVYKKKPQNKENVLASYKGYLLNCECNSYLKKNHFHFME